MPASDAELPNVDELLSAARVEEHGPRRGRLKVFLGYAAGVGKTYTMLQQAQWRQAEGVDVVVGHVETHDRAETDALLDGIETVPRRHVASHGTDLVEPDLDAILARRPALALVDELAHTNAPGGRHDRRYQDVEELLAAGISVYTTMNVQHLESLRDAVAQVTGVVVRDTLPDQVLDSADEIALVDLSPDDLLRRLSEGRVFLPAQGSDARERFFRRGNLTALREMALRRAASRVDSQLSSYMQTRSIPGPWPAGERLLVCVGPGPLSARLLRATRRLADDLKAHWLALYVETPDQVLLRPAAKERLAGNLHLAEQLGAQVTCISGASVADAAVAYARRQNVTKIVVGKPLRSRLGEWLRGSIVDRIVRRSGSIDVCVVSSAGETATTEPQAAPRGRLQWGGYLRSAGLVAAATALGLPLRSHVEPTNLVMLYLAAVLVAALYLGRREALLASLLGVMAFDFFLVPPHLTLAVSDTQYVLTFAGLLVVGLVISSLAARTHAQAEAAQQRESQAVALYELSRALAATSDLRAALETVVAHLRHVQGADCVVLLPGPSGLEVAAGGEGLELDTGEMAVATWAWREGREAGPGTDTSSGAGLRYLPLQGRVGTLGVLGIRLSQPGGYLSPEDRRLLDSVVSLAALAVERVQLAEQANQAQVLRAAESLHSALLGSISHDLRTPLASITGVLSSLRESVAGAPGFALEPAPFRELVDTALGEAERLNHLVGNLLDMSRLEAGALRLTLEPCDVQDLVGAVLGQLGARLEGHPVELALPDSLPLVPMDFVLIAQVLVNLLENAAKFSPPGAPIEVAAGVTAGQVELTVADRGAGIPEGDRERVFDKFQRVHRPGDAGGTGLGLAISRGIVEVHGGQIRAQARPGGGTVMRVTLPLESDAATGGRGA